MKSCSIPDLRKLFQGTLSRVPALTSAVELTQVAGLKGPKVHAVVAMWHAEQYAARMWQEAVLVESPVGRCNGLIMYKHWRRPYVVVVGA